MIKTKYDNNCAIVYQGEVNDKLGMAMGGLGTGTLEIDRAGRFQNILVQNNWNVKVKPVPFPDFMSVFAENESEKHGCLLQLTHPAERLSCIDKLQYSGSFPFTNIEYNDEKLPVDISMEAFSPFVPHDADSSSYPAIIFSFRIYNQGTKKVRASVAMSWQNDIAMEPFLNGIRPQGNINRLVEAPVNGVLMETLNDQVKGSEYFLGTIPDLEDESNAVADWWQLKEFRCVPDFVNANGDMFIHAANEDEAAKYWESFLETGTLPKQREKYDGLGKYSYHCPAGAVSDTIELQPGETKTVKFMLCWYFPHNIDRSGLYLGNKYNKRFPGGAIDVAKEIMDNHKVLRNRSRNLREMVLACSLPKKTKQYIMNTAYLLPRISWWTENNRFMYYEAIACTRIYAICLETYAAPGIAALFPEQHKQGLKNIPALQLESGEIPTTLGHYGSGNCPEYRVFSIVDVPNYVLSVYLNVLWYSGREFANEMYDSVKRALQWGMTLDRDGDGVPDCNGINQAWDTWPMKGASAYVADLWLNALVAGQKIAKILDDSEFAEWCEKRHEKISETVENNLWNESYYDLFYNCLKEDRCETSFLQTFMGHELGKLCGLDWQHPEDRVKKTFDAIWKLNVETCKNCAVTGGTPSGGDKNSKQSNSFCAAAIAPMCAMAIRAGKVAPAFELFEECSGIIIEKIEEPWRGQLFFNADTCEWVYGFHYSDLFSIWHILHAIIGLSVNVTDNSITLSPPRIPAKGPVFTKLFYGIAEFIQADKEIILELTNKSESDSWIVNLTIHLPSGEIYEFKNVKIKTDNNIQYKIY